MAEQKNMTEQKKKGRAGEKDDHSKWRAEGGL